MGLRPHNATTPGSRHRVSPDFSELTQGNTPEKSLTEKMTRTGGRNHYGRITRRFRGGGPKRRFRPIPFPRRQGGGPAKGATPQYDPNPPARTPPLHYAHREKEHIHGP